VATPGDGRWQVTWQAVDCPVNGNINYLLQGSNPWYLKLGIRNARIGILSVAAQISAGGPFVTLQRTSDNFFVCNGCSFPYATPLALQITGVNGQVLRDALPALTNDVYQPGQVQFAAFHP
jgi:expansin (peptidoglycan-binding protein)